MDTWEKFKKTVERYALAAPGDKVLLAVSGGPDSVSLLHLFWRLAKTMPLELHAVCLDHGLRKQAAREVKLVQKLALGRGIPFTSRTLPVAHFAKSNKVSLETAGRTLRYRALAGIARELGCTGIATGHTANDNAETVMMWLIRGTGTEGLAGIPITRGMEGKLRVIRPLLFVTRKEIESYVRSQKLPSSIDASNYSLEYTRNRIRHGLLPLLEKYNPRFVEHVSGLSDIVAAENEFLSAQALAALRRSAVLGPNKITLDLKGFFRYNKVIQSRLLKALLPEKRSRSHIELLRTWILYSSDKDFDFSRTWHVEKRRDTVLFRKHHEKAS